MPIDDGAPAPIGPVIHAMLEASATVGGVPAEIQFAGLAPGCAGLAQMNLKVPPLPAGIYPVIVKMGGVASNAARLSVRSGSKRSHSSGIGNRPPGFTPSLLSDGFQLFLEHLLLREIRVVAARGHEFRVCSLLHNTALLQHHDPVCLPNG